MIPLNLKMDRDLLNLLQLRGHKVWPLLHENSMYIEFKKQPNELNEIFLYSYPTICCQTFVNESILVDNELNCYIRNRSKTPNVFINKLKNDSLKNELKSHILKYGLDYSFDDIVKEYEEIDF